MYHHKEAMSMYDTKVLKKTGEKLVAYQST